MTEPVAVEVDDGRGLVVLDREGVRDLTAVLRRAQPSYRLGGDVLPDRMRVLLARLSDFGHEADIDTPVVPGVVVDALLAGSPSEVMEIGLAAEVLGVSVRHARRLLPSAGWGRVSAADVAGEAVRRGRSA